VINFPLFENRIAYSAQGMLQFVGFVVIFVFKNSELEKKELLLVSTSGEGMYCLKNVGKQSGNNVKL
jgi:hypothetical protein